MASTTSVDIKQLLEAGAHFGHKASRWHPKMSEYIHSKRDGNHIIDLIKTVEKLEEALAFIEKTVSEGKQVLFVGTKRQAKDTIKKIAEETSMPYVSERWLGGMLTNQNTIGGRIKHLKELEDKMESGNLAAKHSKLELQRFQEEIDRLNFMYGGVKDMAIRPGALFVVDIVQESNAVKEATKLDIPVVAMVDTNANPGDVAYPIPANDDAIKSIQLITEHIKSAVESGKANQKKAEKAEDKKEGE